MTDDWSNQFQYWHFVAKATKRVCTYDYYTDYTIGQRFPIRVPCECVRDQLPFVLKFYWTMAHFFSQEVPQNTRIIKGEWRLKLTNTAIGVVKTVFHFAVVGFQLPKLKITCTKDTVLSKVPN